MSRSQGLSDEAGLAVVWAIALVGLLTTVALVCVGVGGLVQVHRRAQSAADLSALAGAGALRDGSPACPVAARIAHRNDGRLTSCRVAGSTVSVQVEVTAPGLLGHSPGLRARSVAGPSTPAVAPAG